MLDRTTLSRKTLGRHVVGYDNILIIRGVAGPMDPIYGSLVQFDFAPNLHYIAVPTTDLHKRDNHFVPKNQVHRWR